MGIRESLGANAPAPERKRGFVVSGPEAIVVGIICGDDPMARKLLQSLLDYAYQSGLTDKANEFFMAQQKRS
jgi:hypothetical protein